MFEKASRLKLRFDTPKGMITTEDVWDLPLTSRNGASLDNLAKALNKAVKEVEEESFVVSKSATNSVLELKFEIVKRVIEVRLAEAEASKKAVEIKAEKELYDSIIADKEHEGLKDMSIEDLKKKRATL